MIKKKAKNTILTSDYFPHDADIGIIGRGETLEKAFVAAAQAMFGIMMDMTLVAPKFSVAVSFTESDKELALVTWLNLLLALAREHALVFSHFQLKRDEQGWQGIASGDRWHEEWDRGTEVKGATLTMLSVKQIDQYWEACCIVDV